MLMSRNLIIASPDEDVKDVAKKMTLDTVYFLKGKSTEVKNG